MKLCMFYMEKQPLLLLITITLTAGALFLEKRTSSHLLRADGLGRFSGTIVSSEFRLHGGHILLSLHLGPFKFSFDSTATCISLAMARSSPPTKPPPISSPIIMHAAPSTHRFLHFSFLNQATWEFFVEDEGRVEPEPEPGGERLRRQVVLMAIFSLWVFSFKVQFNYSWRVDGSIYRDRRSQ